MTILKMKKATYFILLTLFSIRQLTAQKLDNIVNSNILLVRFDPAASQTQRIALQNLYQAKEIAVLKNIGINVWQISLPVRLPNGTLLSTMIDVSNNANGTGTVVTSDPDYGMDNEPPLDPTTLSEVAPSPLPDCPTYLNGCNIKSSNPVVVAVIDCGIAGTYSGGKFVPRHALFTNKIWSNRTELDNRLDDDQNGYIDDVAGWNWVSNNNLNIDDNNHGSHVSGIIAQVTANNPNITMMNLKTQDARGSGSLRSILSAIDYAAGQKVKIINLSLSRSTRKSINNKSILTEVVNTLGQNMLFVVAAGNATMNLDDNSAIPFAALSNSPNVIIVGASNCNGEKAAFSNFGGKSVHIAAPGVRVRSALMNGGYGYMNGTSMATPFVTATAALLGTKLTWNPSAIKDIILRTGTPNATWQNLSLTGSVLNIGRALGCIKSKDINNDLLLNDNIEGLTVVPNPFEERVQIQLKSMESATAQLLIQNTVGQMVYNQNVILQKGDNQLEWLANAVPKGIYLVQIKCADTLLTQKIVKQ
ncbi:MAG: hypothetical protein RLZZ628_237 [Bacteroidota bacterium]